MSVLQTSPVSRKLLSRSVLGVVPARIGSKGIPRKNLKPLGGVPLVSWTLRFARLNAINVIVSTDADELAEVARSEGAHVPFLRSAELSADDTPSVDVVLDCLDFTERSEGKSFDYVAMLEPTSPFRRETLLLEALALLTSGQAESAVTVMPAGNGHPNFAMKPIDLSLVGFETPFGDSMTKRRQNCPPIFFPEGCLYISTVESLRRNGTFYHARTALIRVGPIESIDIDEPDDLALAELVLAGLRQRHELAQTEDAHDPLGWMLS